MKLKNTFLLSIILFLMILSNQEITAQTPGLIYENPGISVLDPNGDGYVSQTTSGFSANDQTESEIQYAALPVLEFEPDSDQRVGPYCSYTDIVDNGIKNALYAYYDGTNILFRFRLSGTASNAKGYSIMVDSDQKFGFTGSEADPDAVVGNPGFEFEIVLETKRGIALYDVNGKNYATEIGNAATQRPYASYAQKSIALTTNCNTPDYFYDFYVSMADLNAAFGIDQNTLLRFTGTTVTDTSAFIGSPGASDIAGTNEFCFGDIFDCIPPIKISEISTANTDCRTSCPSIDGVIEDGATTVSGTGIIGAEINVFKNGTTIGTTNVDGTGNWSLININSTLISGDTITATAKDGTRYVSFNDCNIKIVECSPALTITSVGGKGIFGTYYISGAVFRVYLNGTEILQGGDSLFTDKGSGNWAFSCAGNLDCTGSGVNCMDIGWYEVTQQIPGSCESVPVGICYNGVSSTVPIISSNPIKINTNPITGTGIPGSAIILYQNNSHIGTGTVNGSGDWSISPVKPLTICSEITASQVEANKCRSNLSLPITVIDTIQFHKPIITGDYCVLAATTVSTITGTSVEEENSVIEIFVNSSSVGTSTVQANATWELTGLSINIGDTITAQVISGPACLSKSAVSDAVIVKKTFTNDAFIIGTYYEGDGSVSGSGSTDGRFVYLYQDDVLIGSDYISGSWSVSGLETTLYAGGALTVTIDSTGMCESDYSAPAVIVQCKAPLDNRLITAVQSEYCENDNAEIIVKSSENGIIYTPVLRSDSTVIGYSELGTGNDLTLTTYPFLLSGTYNITVKAEKPCGIDCIVFNTNDTSLQINPLPDKTLAVSPAAVSICRGNSVDITITNAENGITYQLQNAADNINIGSSAVGDGINNLIIPTGLLDTTITIKVIATDNTYPTNCSVELDNTVKLTVNGPN
ncbi:MAG: Ig-like domain-containing protein, partial [Bacteroidales bacterium]|nr:Ig-like domain-containing protein [Bacteroidales bacterium]